MNWVEGLLAGWPAVRRLENILVRPLKERGMDAFTNGRKVTSKILGVTMVAGKASLSYFNCLKEKMEDSQKNILKNILDRTRG